MVQRPTVFLPPSARTRTETNREADRRRGSARERGYTARWDKAAKTYLAHHPLCAYCEAGVFGDPSITAASLVDHLYPQRTYAGTMWATEWWVSSCKPCHDGPKQAIEREGHTALDALALRLCRPPLPT